MAGSDDRPPSRSNLLAALVVGILVVMLVPMPTVVLDLLLTVNISLGLLILVSVMNAGKPADFTGAVGQFRLTGDVDRTSVDAGDPVTLTVKLSGAGAASTPPLTA